MSDFWNQKFSSTDYFYGDEPNDFLRSQLFRLKPGSRVLVVGDGEGRNGVWLAEQGFKVTSVDYSSVGCEKSRRLAAQKGVTLTTDCADLLTWPWPVAEFDAVVSIFLHFLPDDRRTVHRAIEAALAPEGWLVIELFHPKQLGYTSGGPKNPDMLVTTDELKANFPALNWWLIAEGCTHLTEGSGHVGMGYISHAVGQKPALAER
jgi:SAM-dependent methyltransferase